MLNKRVEGGVREANEVGVGMREVGGVQRTVKREVGKQWGVWERGGSCSLK